MIIIISTNIIYYIAKVNNFFIFIPVPSIVEFLITQKKRQKGSRTKQNKNSHFYML